VSIKPAERIPKLRHHKATGQAYVVLNGKAIYFGPAGTSEAEQKYHQAIAEWLAAGRQHPQPPTDITIKEVAVVLGACAGVLCPAGRNTDVRDQ